MMFGVVCLGILYTLVACPVGLSQLASTAPTEAEAVDTEMAEDPHLDVFSADAYPSASACKMASASSSRVM